LSFLSDEHLIKSCTGGIQEHCKLLFERYRENIKNLIWYHVGDTETTKDILQETFLKAYRGLKNFRGDSSFKTWLTRIAVNLCKDHFRTSGRRNEKYHVSVDDTEDNNPIELRSCDADTDPQRQFSRKQLKNAVAAAVQKLTPEHREAILLWNEGYSQKEIAKITNTSVNTVGTRIYYAKMRLRELLKAFKDED